MNQKSSDPSTPSLPSLEELGERLRIASRRSDPPPRVSRRLLTAAVLSLAAALALTLTPPGRSLADQLGELVGIGDPPTLPYRLDNGKGAIVVDVGEAPNGTPFEIVASAHLTGDADRPDEACLSLDLPEGEIYGGGPCYTRDNGPIVERTGLWTSALTAPKQFQPESEVSVSGFVRSDVTSVVVRYPTPDGTVETLEARLVPVSDEVLRQIGGDVAQIGGGEGGLTGFFALLPGGVLSGMEAHPSVISDTETGAFLSSVEVVASGAEGPIASKSPDARSYIGAMAYEPPERFTSALRVGIDCAIAAGPIGNLDECVERKLGFLPAALRSPR